MGVLNVPLIFYKIFINAAKISGGIMKVKELIKLLQQAPENIDINVFDNLTENLLLIDDVWIPKKEDMKSNKEVQLVINKTDQELKVEGE